MKSLPGWAWGKGYASETGGALDDRASARHHWPGLTASVRHDKPASMQVVAKLGFAAVARADGVSRARGPGRRPLRRCPLPRP